ncbi:hypothetical protein GOBAR_AA36698 [Gossypium barbadense]|uniref:DNA-directed RNA polymerase n=1 Tax=Gossypium barbadense TaxID=3634 RepID=A0A2P5VYX8_GOSBA|nr:hypothetical protein GOBAR_AA36698 [Gossypium barbadense]
MNSIWKYSIHFFYSQGFDTFRSREISTGAGAIREQLADLDLRILIDYSVVEWKELGEEGLTGNEWEDRKIGRRKDFLVDAWNWLSILFRTNIEPEWMVLCLLPVLPPELRPIIQIDGGKLSFMQFKDQPFVSVFSHREFFADEEMSKGLLTSHKRP